MAYRTEDNLESVCVSIGPPYIRNVTPKFSVNPSSSAIQVFEFNDQSENTEQKTLPLVGRSGAGKSMLINSLFNYIVGINWEDAFRYNFIQDKPQTSGRSQTQNVTVYTLHHKNVYKTPYTFTVIDTPGFENTSIDLSDEIIADKLRQFLNEAWNEGIVHIHAVGFVVPTTLQRFSDVELYIYKTLEDLFGKDIYVNLCFIVTFADFDPPALHAISRSGIPQPSRATQRKHRCIKFNNCALFSAKDERAQEQKKFYWEQAHDGCKDLLLEISELTGISLIGTNPGSTNETDLCSTNTKKIQLDQSKKVILNRSTEVCFDLLSLPGIANNCKVICITITFDTVNV